MAGCEDEEDFLVENEAHLLPWDRFRKWVTCFCVVTFDIELGQAMEVRLSLGECVLCINVFDSIPCGVPIRLYLDASVMVNRVDVLSFLVVFPHSLSIPNI